MKDLIDEVRDLLEEVPMDVAPVTDLWPDMCHGPHRPRTHLRRAELLSLLGFGRYYVVAPPPGYVWFSGEFLQIAGPHNPYSHYGLDSIIHGGDPVFESVHAAHRAGMEVFAVMKPYEGGSGITLPAGGQPPVPRICFDQIGGLGVGYDVFLEEHPEMRVSRKPIPDYERLVAQPIRSIEIVFSLERIEETAEGWEIKVFPAQQDSVVAESPLEEVRLWISSDNGTYRPYEGTFEVSERLESRTLYDANGFPLSADPSRCRVVTIDGLSLSADVSYLAVEFPDRKSPLRTNPFSMITVKGDLGDIPVTCTDAVRRVLRSGDEKGGGGAGRDFRELGFEFDWHGSGMWGSGWRESGCYGIARGKYSYMKGTHCEAYPEVREYWLDQIDKLIAMGVDGVDIRLQNHSGMIGDWACYGYNPPLVEAYRKQYGIDILSEEADPMKLMRLRGGFFLEFLEEAAKRLHGAGRKLQLHLRDGQEKPQLRSDHGHAGWWAMPKIVVDWERAVDLADEISIKDYNFGRYDSEVADGIKTRGKETGKPVWVHCYIQQGADMHPEFFEAVRDDSRIHGLLLYETIHSAKYDLGLIRITPDGVPHLHERSVEELAKALRGAV